jgi:hypothetical protein
MSDASEIAELRTRIEKLELLVGIAYYGKTAAEIRAMLTPDRTIPGERYSLMQSDVQIRDGIADLAKAIEANDTSIEALAEMIRNLPDPASGAVSVIGSVLPLRAPAGAVAVKEMRDASSTLLTSDLLHGQLEFGGDETHRVFTGPTAFIDEVGIGGFPIKGVPLAMRKNGGVAFVGERSDGTQEGVPMVRAAMVWHEHHDNGFRIMQGGVYAGGKLYRTGDKIRMMALDGAGKFSMSLEDYASGRVERGQLWAVWEDLDNPEGPMLWLQGCMAGLGIGVVGSTQTMNEHNPNANDRGIVLIAPIKPSREATRADLVNVP